MEGPGAGEALDGQAVYHTTIPHPNPALGFCCTNWQLDQVAIVLEQGHHLHYLLVYEN